MDFFHAQDNARRRTRWLVVLFALAVAAVVGSVYGVGLLIGQYLGERTGVVVRPDWGQFGITAAVVGGTILSGSVFKLLSLSRGGAVIARDLGGRRIDPNTSDPDERRLRNVVEEMAIASGMVCPEVWVLDDEPSINAFAAGTEPGNTVVAVTRGCLETLSRSELQGVVAHEFSHILNGDMKLNMRLIGWLFGILMIAIAGRTILGSLRHVRTSGRNNKNGGGGILVVLAAGASLWLIGMVGVFFGRLIQAAISRQREFLADAAAVQFTRHPEGIAGALKKIGGSWREAYIHSPKASEASHLFFASAELVRIGFSTHPPLAERIRAIEPSWDGQFIKPEPHRPEPEEEEAPRQMTAVPQPPASMAMVAAMATLGTPQLAHGAALRQSLAPEWLAAARTPEEAEAMFYGLLLADDSDLQARQVEFLGAAGQPAAFWHAQLAPAHSSQKIALLEVGIPALRRVPQPYYQQFKERMQWLIASDGQLDLFEFMLQKLVERHLDMAHHLRQPARIQFRHIGELASQARTLVAAIAHLSESPAEAFAAASAEFAQHTGQPFDTNLAIGCDLNALSAALDTCDQATPLVKRQILQLCRLAATHDRSVANHEITLLRAIADAIGCQIPIAATEALELAH